VTASQLQEGHQVRLLQGGAEFFPSLIAAIEASTREVRLETYIFSFDATGEQVAAALERAARRGIGVYLIMDGIGTPEVPAAWAKRLTDARTSNGTDSLLWGVGAFWSLVSGVAAPAPQALRGRRSYCLLRRHQCFG